MLKKILASTVVLAFMAATPVYAQAAPDANAPAADTQGGPPPADQAPKPAKHKRHGHRVHHASKKMGKMGKMSSKKKKGAPADAGAPDAAAPQQ